MTPAPTLALSFLAGLVSFLSPCIVPLVPSYLSFVGGVAATESGDGAHSRRVVILRTALFVLGFTIVFVALGVLFSGSGALFTNTGTVINVIAGGVVVVLGLNIIFDFWKFLNIERRVHLTRRPAGHLGAIVIGMAFGAGWTPCIGPILASVLLLAGTSGNVATGTLYLTAFSLGLGLPFLLAGVFFGRAAEALRKVRRYLPAIKIASGVLLVLMGVLIATGRLSRLSARLLAAGSRLAAWNAANPLVSNWLFAMGAAVVSVVPLVLVLVRAAGRRENTANRTRETAAPASREPVETRRGAPARDRIAVGVTAAIAVGGVSLAILNVVDVIDLAEWFSSWFRYTGI